MTPPLRSLLFIPGDHPRKLEKGLGAGADALVIDLEDSVAPARKTIARAMTADFVTAAAGARTPAIWVRVNPLSLPACLGDLAAIVRARPAGVVLPKCGGIGDVIRLGHYLDVLEERDGVAPGSIRILPVVTETAAAPFGLGEFRTGGLSRLMGLTWGAEDLSAALGATSNVDETGQWSLTYRIVRSGCLLAAKAAEVECIETLYADYRDREGLAASCRAARREGFSGRFAIHPDQVDAINAGFLPDETDVTFARRVVAAFAERPHAGAIGLDGRMLDLPHLRQARQVLALAAAYAANGA